MMQSTFYKTSKWLPTAVQHSYLLRLAELAGMSLERKTYFMVAGGKLLATFLYAFETSEELEAKCLRLQS